MFSASFVSCQQFTAYSDHIAAPQLWQQKQFQEKFAEPTVPWQTLLVQHTNCYYYFIAKYFKKSLFRDRLYIHLHFFTPSPTLLLRTSAIFQHPDMESRNCDTGVFCDDITYKPKSVKNDWTVSEAEISDTGIRTPLQILLFSCYWRQLD